jgi:hypothetical protein
MSGNMSCLDLYETTFGVPLKTSMPSQRFYILHADGREWKGDHLKMRLNKGTPAIFQKYVSDKVFKSSEGRFGLIQNGNTNLSVRHSGRVMFTHPFADNNFDFAWLFQPTGNKDEYIIYNDYEDGTYVGYDNSIDRILVVQPGDNRITKWIIKYVDDYKNSLKALAFASHGQTQNEDGSYQQTSYCVYPQETMSMLNFDDSCVLKTPITKGVENSNFSSSLTNKLYPTSGCAIVNTNTGSFKKAMNSVAMNIEVSNSVALKKLRSKLSRLQTDVSTLSDKAIPAQQASLKQLIQKLDDTNEEWKQNDELIEWAESEILPNLKTDIGKNSVTYGKVVELLNAMKEKLRKAQGDCDKKEYADWQRFTPAKPLSTISASKGLVCGTTDTGEAWCIPPKGEWTKVGDKLRQVSIDGRQACGTAFNDEIYCTDDILNPAWTRVNGSLRQIDVAAGKMCGTAAAGSIWCADFKKDNWYHKEGWLKHLAINNRLNTCGVNGGDTIWCASDVGYPAWQNIPGSLKQIDVSDAKMCGVNSGNGVWCADLQKPNWKYVKGKQQYVSIDGNTMYALNPNNEIMTRVVPS